MAILQNATELEFKTILAQSFRQLTWAFQQMLPYFYLHVRAGDQLTPDDEGIDLPDFSAARREALLSARELLAEAIKSGKPEVPDAFVIADEAGRTLDIVPLATVLPKPLKK